jgi:phosphate transport system permease protein
MNTPTPAENNLPKRHRIGVAWLWIFQASTIIGIIFLSTLLFNIVNGSFGYAAIQFSIQPEALEIDGTPLEAQDTQQLITTLTNNISRGLARQLERDQPLAERTQEELLALVYEKVLEPKVEQTWTLWDSLTQRESIQQIAAEEYPEAFLEFRSWLTNSFIQRPQNSDPLLAGVRTAILGSLWTILITIVFALPVGVGAAIYLEEYAANIASPTLKRINSFIQTNINNLAGVPSIIYGMLGLAIFVRALQPLTSGALFDPSIEAEGATGRTIISAGLTLALLVLPVLIINAQEAIRAVPNSLRQASFGIGATRWQTIWHHVLPAALPGVLTGTILAISRAIGETAPLVVVGASTYVTFDPDGPFSKFTTLPIQIYQWTARPQAEFRNIAAAAIIVLMLLLLSMNAIAIVLRNRYSRRII